jgi:hypothetical protein
VVERIYYVNNRACNDKLTQHDISLRSDVEAKETYYIGKRDLLYRQKRPTDTGVTTRRCK